MKTPKMERFRRFYTSKVSSTFFVLGLVFAVMAYLAAPGALAITLVVVGTLFVILAKFVGLLRDSVPDRDKIGRAHV